MAKSKRISPREAKRKRLRSLMVERKLSSRQVGNALHVIPTTVRRWKAGSREMPTAMLEYAEYLFSERAGG